MRPENLIHRVFQSARLDIEIKNRFGQPVVAKEWFLVPRFAIDEAIERIRDGTISAYVHDAKTAKLIKATSQ
jgi:Meiotically Up-regulated Gene 113 (MUG113) protein